MPEQSLERTRRAYGLTLNDERRQCVEYHNTLIRLGLVDDPKETLIKLKVVDDGKRPDDPIYGVFV